MGTQNCFVLHMDIDSFFVQAEQLKNPALKGKAVAVQQHQDIIAANYAAKAAGVRKHMLPAEARRLLRAVGGSVVHVHLAAGARVSYQPYRELSSRMMKLLRGLPWAAVVEKASIDEAYVLLQPGLEAAGEGGISPQVALQRAHQAKAAVYAQLGLCVSVGVAPNRMMSKLASAAAKPDGVKLVAGQREALQLLSQTPASKLPGYGGKAAEAFEQHGVGCATDLQRFSQQQMEQLFGLKPSMAAQLAQWCRGIDATPVQERGPPKTLSVQMSLTPQLLPMRPADRHLVSAAGGAAGVFQPLVVGKPDFKPRVRQLMEAMGLDLLQRVEEDSAEEGGRWPRTLSASMRCFGAGKDQSFTTRSGSFPSHTLAQQAHRQVPQPAAAQQHSRVEQQQQPDARNQQQQQQQPDARNQQQQQQPDARNQQQQQRQAATGHGPTLSPLEEAVVQGLERLMHQAAATYPATATVVELRLAATNFQTAAQAAAAAPITRFFAAAPKPGAQTAGPSLEHSLQREQVVGQQPQRERQQQQQDSKQVGIHQDHGAQAAGLTRRQQDTQQATAALQQDCRDISHARQLQQGGQAGLASHCRSAAEGSSSSGRTRGDGEEAGAMDLGSIDVKEQERILQEIHRQQQARHSRPASTSGPGGGSKRQRKAPGLGDASQPTIFAFLKK